MIVHVRLQGGPTHTLNDTIVLSFTKYVVENVSSSFVI
jgi:hypothetical protein